MEVTGPLYVFSVFKSYLLLFLLKLSRAVIISPSLAEE